MVVRGSRPVRAKGASAQIGQWGFVEQAKVALGGE
jgi:hypothetical protein